MFHGFIEEFPKKDIIVTKEWVIDAGSRAIDEMKSPAKFIQET